MNLNRLVFIILLCVSAVCSHAGETEDLRNALNTAQGERRLLIYGKLYMLSLETDDADYQLKCVNDLIAEAHRQGNKRKEGDYKVIKMVLLYNLNMNDSIYEQVPKTIEFLGEIKDWKNYYETWTILVDTYNFSGQTNTGLEEAEDMFEDAAKRENRYGMGLAYYSMGNVYATMHNYEEAAGSYQKSIDLLMTMSPRPLQLAEVFSYYTEVLEILKQYKKMSDITSRWKYFLASYYITNDNSGEAMNRWGYYYMACAQAALGLGNLEEASAMLDEVKKRCTYEDGNLNKMWLIYRTQLCMKQGFLEEALALNDQSMKLLEETDDNTMPVRIRKQRAEILERLGNYEEAAEMYKEMYAINDSVNTHDTKSMLAEMNARFDLGELKLKQQRARTQYAIIIASIIVLALIIFIYFRMRSAKRLKVAHNKLEEAHEKLEDAHSSLEIAHNELLTAYDQLEETTAAKERIESDLRIARDIQMSMVPSTFPERDDLDLFASMTPAKEVGGDLYGYHLIDDQLYFCLGDVSGKGVPASLFMAQATRLFRTLAAQKMMPAEIATSINEALSGEDNERSMFVTMFLGLVDIKTGHLHFCNAGHNPPVLIGNGTAEFIEMIPNCPIGLWPGMEYEGEEIEDITDHPLFVYTDGLNEAENWQQEQFTDERLLEILQTTPFESSQQTVEMLKAAVEKHREGADPNDDLTMLCLKVTKCKDNQSE
jgi:serine phosphatase RsbU (regulator of sigma subunit)